MGVKIYDANAVTIIVGIIPIESGFADGEFARIEQDEQFVIYNSADGEVARSKTNMKSARVTIILAQTSSSNAALSLLHTTDITVDNGAGVVPLVIRDRQGLSVFNAVSSWIVKYPDESYDKEVTTREWTFDAVVTPASRFVGGN